jgi:hypothetical protein
MTSARLTRRVSVLASLLVLLAACGNSSSAASKVATLSSSGGNNGGVASSTTLSPKQAQDKILAYAACMRQNGVNMKDPTFDANGNMTGGGLGRDSGVDPRSTAFQTAQKACGSLIQGVNIFGRRGRIDQQQMQTAFNDFTACLRTNGLPNVKDVTFGPPGGGPDDNNSTGNNNGGGNQTPGQVAAGGGSNSGGNNDGSVPGRGFGPPPGSFDPGRNAPGGAGFDPTTRLLDRLGLDATDPTVKKAVSACTAIITKAFQQATGSTTTTQG